MRRSGRRRVSRATIWGLLGAALLAAGCFAPIAALPGGGAATLIGSGSVPARLILVAALCSIALVLLRRRALLITGGFAGLMILLEFLEHRNELLVVAGPGSSADAVLSSFATEWGWALLVIGAALLLLAGLFPGRRR